MGHANADPHAVVGLHPVPLREVQELAREPAGQVHERDLGEFVVLSAEVVDEVRQEPQAELRRGADQRAKVLPPQRHACRRVHSHRVGRLRPGRFEHAELAEHLTCADELEDELASLARRARDTDQTPLDHEQRVGRLALAHEIRARREGAPPHPWPNCAHGLRGQAGEERGPKEHGSGLLAAAIRRAVGRESIGLDRRRSTFDGDDVTTWKRGRRCHARSCGAAVDMDGAGAALGDTAPVLGAGQVQLVT